jgi:hypothetical protein
LSIFVLAVIAVFVFLNLTNIKKFQFILSNYYAKELCSCLFVLGQEEDYCHHVVKHYIPISTYKIDHENRETMVSSLGVQAEATYFSQNLGCRLKVTEFPSLGRD